ncbi:MAG TPA: dienelactone hydrolase family protein [Alphaproteobacteria bacterium]|nr:dienelactone hydrolase family protein [Alphaproteobacteria bacterium]
MPEVTIAAADGGSFSAYLARPATGKGPGVVVCQEIFGVNHVMREVCLDLAKQGHFAICPDLFWRQQPGIQITDKTQAEWARAFELYKGFNEAKGVDDLKATLNFMRKHEGCTGKVGAVGFCLGGKLAYLMATRTTADCNVGYYGVGIEAALDEAKNIKKPLMLHIAEKDEYCPAAAQAKIKASLGSNKLVTIHSYAAMNHAFARVGGQHYDKASAELANGRTFDFFKKALG